MFPLRNVIFPLILVLSLFAGCAASRARGVYHTVGKGETLWRISYTYGVDLSDVKRANRIKDATQIDKGSRIFIPGAKRVLKVTPYPAQASLDKETPSAPGARPKKNRPRYIWPVRGRVSSSYGLRNGVMHDGIDIIADEGTPVKSADDGVVVYEGDRLRGYGNIIIIKHKDNYYTVYAHNRNNLVDEGSLISRGDVIAKVGSTGNATTNQLHFEVREGRTTLNPLFFLP